MNATNTPAAAKGRNPVSFGRRLNARIWRFYKTIYWLARKRRKQDITFVVGDAKCGKSVLCNAFELDRNSRVFRERSKITGGNGGPQRLKDWQEVKRIVDRCPEPLIFIEAKTDSQHLPELLGYFERSAAIWMYRHYESAVDACLERFQHPVEALKPIVNGDRENWRSERITDDLRATVSEFFHEDMLPADAMALMWLVRNRLVFDLALPRLTNFRLCKFENLTTDPERTLDAVYRTLKLKSSANLKSIASHVPRPQRVARVCIDPDIAHLCDQLEQQLDSCDCHVQ